MDYFLMNECIFKELIKNNKEFIIMFLKSIDINIEDYQLFEIDIKTQKIKIDILLFTSNLVINIELNKKKESLKRNIIYFDTLKKLLPSYQVVQININLFKEKNQINGIYNYSNQNEYIKFITAKSYNDYGTKNNYILKTIKFLNSIDKTKYTNKIKSEHSIKEKLDNLITD